MTRIPITDENRKIRQDAYYGVRAATIYTLSAEDQNFWVTISMIESERFKCVGER